MRYKGIVMYDGTLFSGWQIQPNQRTVQSEIESILSIMHKKEVKIVASGRTDAGVHALGQVFHFDSELDLDEKKWCHALNAQLPSDIRVMDIKQVHDMFHARFDAMSKTYIYKLNTSYFDVFSRNYIYQYNKPLDIFKLQEVLQLFIGTHDFTSFNKTPLDEIVDQVRTISNFTLVQQSSIIEFEITGSGFLRHMIRMIIATCLAYCEGRISETEIKDALKKRNKDMIPFNISGSGLYLKEVHYR